MRFLALSDRCSLLIAWVVVQRKPMEFLVICLVYIRNGWVTKEDTSLLKHASTTGQAMWINSPHGSPEGHRWTHRSTLPHRLCGKGAALEAEDLVGTPAPDTPKLCDREVYKLLSTLISPSVKWRQPLHSRLERAAENRFMPDVLYSIFIKYLTQV